jgi:glycine cleavage system H protein
MAELRFTTEHEWIRVENGIGTVGITDYAQQQLGDVVYVDLPDIGKLLEKGGEVAVVESVKAASEIYSPVSGEVVAVNDKLPDAPGQVNQDAQGSGWFFQVRLADSAELAALMDETAYAEFVKGLA